MVVVVINNKPFTRYKLDGELRRDTFTCAINQDERALLERMKSVLEQEKDSTALKTLAWIGAKVLQEEKMSYVLSVIYANKRKNKRIGVAQFEL